MPGDPMLGAVIRGMRLSRGLTLAAVARRAGCSQSLLSQVETGKRDLQMQLARLLDGIFETGGSLAALTGESRRCLPDQPVGGEDVVLVHVPKRGTIMPVSRRELLAGLGIGAIAGASLDGLQRAVTAAHVDEELLAELGRAFDGFQSAARMLLPQQLSEPLTALIALVDAARRAAPMHMRPELMTLQIRVAEALSWMAEESGEVTAALYWMDRAQQWADIAQWHGMIAYTYVRRSMLAISHALDGMTAVEQAVRGLRMRQAPARIRGLAAKQMAYGLALSQRADATKHALDQAAVLFTATTAQYEETPSIGQGSVDDASLLMIYQATCDVYLGGGSSVIDVLEPRMNAIATGSPRTHAISSAKLAGAYAQAGEPAHACELVLKALEEDSFAGSQSARSEVRRVLPVLDCWPNRSDVREVRHRLGQVG